MLLHTAQSLDLTAESVYSDLRRREVGAVGIALCTKDFGFRFLFCEKLCIFRKFCVVFGDRAFAVLAFSFMSGGKTAAFVYVLSCRFVASLILFIGTAEKLETRVNIGNFFLCRGKLVISKSDRRIEGLRLFLCFARKRGKLRFLCGQRGNFSGNCRRLTVLSGCTSILILCRSTQALAVARSTETLPSVCVIFVLMTLIFASSS